MQAQALFFLLLQFRKQPSHLLHELAAVSSHLVIDRALNLLLNGDILRNFLVHELHEFPLKFFYSLILEANLLLSLGQLFLQLLGLPLLPNPIEIQGLHLFYSYSITTRINDYRGFRDAGHVKKGLYGNGRRMMEVLEGLG